VTGFHYEISSRIATVRENLREAVERDDHYLTDVHTGELESLARLAADHGVVVDGLPHALPGTGPIDLRLAEQVSPVE
jgi:hypothetical protein